MQRHARIPRSLDSFLVAVVATTFLMLVLALGSLVGCVPADVAPQAGDLGAASQEADSPQGSQADASSAIETHGQLGDFQAGTLDGGTFTQADVASHDVTVLYFWSTTCGPCVSSTPKLASLAERLPANVQIATVCFDGSYNAARAQEVLDAAGFPGPTVVTTSKDLTQLANQVQYTPTTVFVASDGTVVGDVFVGTPAKFDAAYLDAVNAVLAWQGKEAVALEPAA